MGKEAFTIVDKFEQCLCDYTGAPYAIALDNCSNAIFLALVYSDIKDTVITIPSHTYPSVPCEIIHAGGIVEFQESSKFLEGPYRLKPTSVIDSSLRFTYGMYENGRIMCLSFTGPYKHLKLGKGGAILTDDAWACNWFKRARFSGRREMSYHDDYLDMLGWNFYMLPEIAARGCHLIRQFYDTKDMPIHNKDLRIEYPDLSQFPVYKNHHSIWNYNLEGESL